jgi:polar amino acid transport system substrate-binding protein
MFSKLFVFCSLVFLFGCSSNSTTTYEVAIDPTWNPINFKDRQSNVLGFTTELLTQVSQEEKIQISILSTNWDSILDGLNSRKYAAILSPLHPYKYNEEIYSFSEPFLEIGPVIVAPIDSKDLSINDLSGEAVGAIENSSEILLLEKDPTILIRTYDSVPDALNALVSEHIQAAILPVLEVTAYVDHLYFRKLKIVSKPLNEDGLRMITLKDQSPELREKFNKVLKQMKSDGSYQKLLSKWNLES